MGSCSEIASRCCLMLELLIILLAPLLFLPTMTGYYAHSHGRSFWRWFLVGCGLPFFSLLVVAGVVHRDQRRALGLLAAAEAEQPAGDVPANS